MSDQELITTNTSESQDLKSLIAATDWLKEKDPDLFEFLERNCVRARIVQHMDNFALHAMENM